jgi:undecaprenyl phosphate-alpha-L-ara4N flippase subunit ArnF
MITSVLLSSFAQLCMKAAMLMMAQRSGALMEVLLTQPHILVWLFVGLGSYAISLVFWLFAISRLDLSLAYPMLSMSYVIVYVVAANWPLLNESLSWIRSLGIIVVILGVILIMHSENSKAEPDHG